MSKVARTAGIIIGGVALIATGVGAFAAAGSALAATAGSVATYASLASGALNILSAVTAPKPVARGSATRTIIQSEPPRPYMIGESYSAGVIRHQVGYGTRRKKVDNPYLWQVRVYSGVGPVQSMGTPFFDWAAIGSYYNGFYAIDTQTGARPEATALVPPLSAPATGWGASHKLSGCAADGLNLLFDKDGKVFASGIPNYGRVIQGELCYDPRLDDTQPGGVGSHRLGNEATYAYSANPALHAGTYAYGRFQDGKKIFGIGIPADGIDWAAVAAWANDCDTNGWECHGTIYEGGEQTGSGVKSNNLTDICASGGAVWRMSGAVLTFDWERPRVSLATFTDQDIMQGGADITALQTHRSRFNAVRPQYISPAHNWEQITAEKIVNSTYVTEDGQEKPQTWPLNLVKDETQAGVLATYAMVSSREQGPVTVPLGIDWSFYRAGDCLTWDSDIIGAPVKLVIQSRTANPVTLETEFVFRTETDAKHAYALGQTATPPPTPIIGQTAQERDAVAGYISDPRGAIRWRTLTPSFPYTPGDGQVAIVAHTAVLEDGREISLPAETITSLAVSTFFTLFWDLSLEQYLVVTAPGTTQMQDSRYVFLAGFKTSDAGTFPSDPTPPDGWNPDPNYQEP